MIDLHPEFLKKDGKPEFAVLPYGEFVEIERILGDAQDLIDLREAKAAAGGTPGVDLEEARRRLGL